MREYYLKINSKKIILALGAESAGNFSVFSPRHSTLSKKYIKTPLLLKGAGGIYFSDDFGDLLNEKNFNKFQKALLNFLKINKVKPNIILTDLHPLYKTTLWGVELAEKYGAKHIQIQHHIAHIFSAIGEQLLQATSYKPQATTFGIALDGTGYGPDGKIWGGEIFRLQATSYKLQATRIGHLENQIMIGGDSAVKEPARMLISILDKIIKHRARNKEQNKKFIYNFVRKFYTKNQFNLLYGQLQNNFNCVETSSTGRVLDAVSILLGFCGNKRNYKHEPIDLLEKNSTTPYSNLKPKIKTYKLQATSYKLMTTPLFEYLIKNLNKDKGRLAATAQLYIAQGINKIIKLQATNYLPTGQAGKLQAKFLAGGITKNKIISNFLKSKGVIINKKIPRSDAGISFGQIIYYLNN